MHERYKVAQRYINTYDSGVFITVLTGAKSIQIDLEMRVVVENNMAPFLSGPGVVGLSIINCKDRWR